MSKAEQQPVLLPEDLVTEILARISSVKSLLRFRCVCKSWSYLLRDPFFIKLHLDRSSSNNKRNLLFGNVSESSYNMSIRCAENMKECFEFIFNHPFYFHEPDILCIEGSCNGLICLSTIFDDLVNKPIYLCNPATRELSILPKRRFSVPLGSTIEYFKLGFGFGDGYKIVRILYMEKFIKEIRDFQTWSHVEIYRLGLNSWETIGDVAPPSPICNNCCGLFHNECIYWISKSKLSIITFDFRHEAFRETLLPKGIGECCLCLGVVQGNISLAFFNSIKSCVEVWVTKEHGECWTNHVVTVERPLTPPPSGLHGMWIVFAFGNDGKVLMRHHGGSYHKNVMYDVEGKSDKDIDATEKYCEVVPYVESLVSTRG